MDNVPYPVGFPSGRDRPPLFLPIIHYQFSIINSPFIFFFTNKFPYYIIE